MRLSKILKIISCVLLICSTSFLEAIAHDKEHPKNMMKNGYLKNTIKNEAFLISYATKIFQLKINGLLHLGASKNKEVELYKKLKINDIIWIDADPKTAAYLEKKYSKNPNMRIFSFAVSNQNGESYFKLGKDGNPGMLVADSSQTTTASEDIIKIQTKKLDDFLESIPNKAIFNAIVIDVEGAELIALKGAVNTLKQIDFIISEVHYNKNYNNVLVTELDEFLLKNNFTRLDTKSKNNVSGMALYVKNSILSTMNK